MKNLKKVNRKVTIPVSYLKGMPKVEEEFTKKKRLDKYLSSLIEEDNNIDYSIVTTWDAFTQFTSNIISH